MITYNHEPYIAQAIEGVLMQKTDFPFELVIGEDGSSDGTRRICEAYQEKYPDRIRLLLRDTNIGMMPNFVQTLSACTGRYTALCEGDDYWTDPHKLQQQVDFLEAHPELNLCYHPVKVLRDGELVEDWLTRPPKADTDILDFARYGNFVHTPSVVMRTNYLPLPSWLLQSPLGDFPLYMLCLQSGRAHLLPDCMAVYRYGSGVLSNQQLARKYQAAIRTFELLRDNLEGTPAAIFARRIPRIKLSITLRSMLKSPFKAGEILGTYWDRPLTFFKAAGAYIAGKLSFGVIRLRE